MPAGNAGEDGGRMDVAVYSFTLRLVYGLRLGSSWRLVCRIRFAA